MKSINLEKIHGDTIVFPNYCPCCGDNSDLSEHYLQGMDIYHDVGSHKNVKHTVSTKIPYCNECLKHAHKYQSGTNYLLGGLVFVLAFILPSMFTDDNGLKNVLFIGLLIAAVVVFFVVGSYNQSKAKAMTKKSCARADWAVFLHPGFINFENKKYAEDFAKLNNIKLDD